MRDVSLSVDGDGPFDLLGLYFEKGSTVEGGVQ